LPFIWGELGVNPFVDENTDRDFHNTLWATTMMGGISTGMYWMDFQERYGISHKKNFNSLSAFCKKIDWKEPLIAGKDFSEGGINCKSNKENKKIFSYWQRNEAKNFAFGWAMNASSVWHSNQSEFFKPEVFTEVLNQLPCYPSANPYDINSSSCNPKIHINDLLPLTKYDIEIYDTYDFSNKLLESFSDLSDLTGNLKFRRQLPFEMGNPFYPDYAFIVRTHESNHNRIRIFPNPADDVVNFEFLDENLSEFTVKLYNELGQLVLIQYTNKKAISVSHLANGFYILQVVYTNIDKTGKLIIHH
jgi:hypothetical protein